MNKSENDKTLLRLSDVARMQGELIRHKNERERIERRIRRLEDQLAAARWFMDSSDFGSEGSGGKKQVTVNNYKRETLPAAIKRLIQEAEHPLAGVDMLRALKKDGVHAQRFKKSAAYFYVTIKRLRDRGEVIKNENRYSLPNCQNGTLSENHSESVPDTMGEDETSPIEH